MQVLPAQRSGRPTDRAARTVRRTIEIDGVATPVRAAADHTTPGRALLPVGDALRFRRPVAPSFAAGAAAGYVAQAIGQTEADDAVPTLSAVAAAAYERADATADICIVAPMPAARLSA